METQGPCPDLVGFCIKALTVPVVTLRLIMFDRRSEKKHFAEELHRQFPFTSGALDAMFFASPFLAGLGKLDM